MAAVGRSFVLLLVLVTQAAARDIHVDNLAGDDRFTGEHVGNLADGAGPVRTIARALELAGPGDRIVLACTEQPYRESLSLVGSRHSGYRHRPFVIEGGGAVLDGSAPVPPEAWEHHLGAVFRFRPPRAGHQQLFIDDLPAPRVPVGPTAIAPPELQPRHWCYHAGFIYFCVPQDKLPRDFNLTYARRQTGITLVHVRHVGIVNLTVQGFRLDGINAHNSARDVYLGKVTCRGNGRSGVTVGGASKVEIDVSLIGNNGQAQLLTLPYSETIVRNSDIFANTAPAWVDRGGRVQINGQFFTGGREEDVVSQEPPAAKP